MPLPYYMTRCTECGEKTTKKYAENHRGYCKSCVEGKPRKQKDEPKKVVPDNTITRNFKRPGCHWIAVIRHNGSGLEATVTCVQSKVCDIGLRTMFWGDQGVDKLCQEIAGELAERENPNGIYNTKTV